MKNITMKTSLKVTAKTRVGWHPVTMNRLAGGFSCFVYLFDLFIPLCLLICQMYNDEYRSPEHTFIINAS